MESDEPRSPSSPDAEDSADGALAASPAEEGATGRDRTSDAPAAEAVEGDGPPAEAAPPAEADRDDAPPSAQDEDTSDATDATATGAKTASQSARHPKRTATRPQPEHVPTEAEIDSPDRRTLLLFGVIFVVTTASWGAAKFSCNYHPAQSRPPPELRTDQLARSPKDAAIEFAYRRRTRDYVGALELTKGPLALEVEKQGEQCESQGAGCINERNRLQKTVLTTAIVTKVDGNQAFATVTHRVGDTEEHYQLRLEKDGLIWKTTSETKL
jgi:hypothetical protein